MTLSEINKKLLDSGERGLTADDKIDLTEALMELQSADDLSEEDAAEIENLFNAVNAANEDDSALLAEVDLSQGLPYKIWSLAVEPRPPFTDPSGLDYKTNLSKRLHPAITMVKGELIKVEYYGEFDGIEYNDKILSVDINWDRDDSGRLIKRTETRKWVVDSDETEYGKHIKVTEKYYTPQLAALADARRRKNIIDDLTSQAEAFGVLTYVQTMFRSLDNELNAYEKTGDAKLIEKIGNYSGQWLESPVPNTDYTLRQAIMGALAI